MGVVGISTTLWHVDKTAGLDIKSFTALWFTTRKPSDKSNGIIWAFQSPIEDILISKNISILNPYQGERTKIFQPEIVSARIQAQSGWFTVHKYMKNEKSLFLFRITLGIKSICLKLSSIRINFRKYVII